MTNQELPPAPPQTPAAGYDNAPLQAARATLPNEEYYRQQPGSEQRHRWGKLLLLLGVLWLVFALMGRFSVPAFGFGFAEESATVSQVVDGRRLVVNLVSDDVRLEPSADGRIHVDATLHGYGWNDAAARQALERLKLDITGNGQEARVAVRRPGGGFAFGFSRSPHVELQLQVPPGTELRIETVSGEVLASDTSGALAVSTTSGDIRLSAHQGALNISTVSGDVELEDGRVNGLTANSTSGDLQLDGVAGPLKVITISGQVEIARASDAQLELQSTSGDLSFAGALAGAGASTISTVSGQVKLDLPADDSFALDASTLSGELRSDFELSGGESSSRRLSGNAGTGGPTLRIETTSGDVEIEQR